MTARRLATLSLALVALFALSACAPAVNPSASNSPGQSGGGSGGSSSSPTPTATPALAPPKVRIPLTCDQLAPSATLASVMGTTMTESDGLPDPDLQKYAAIQDGALNCTWTGAVVKGNANANLNIYVMPDAASTWNDYKSQIQSPIPAAYLGAGLFGGCSGTVTGFNQETCNLDTLSGSVWLDIYAATGEGTLSSSDSVAMTRFKPLLAAAVNAIKGITVAEPAWTDPAATAVHLPPTYGAVNQDAFAAAIHSPFAIEVSQTQYDYAGPQVAELLPVNYRSDGGGGSGAGDPVKPATNFGGTIEILPSGSWAYAQMMAAASGQPGFTQLTGIGTEAFTYKGPGMTGYKNEIIVVGVMGEHLYSIDFASPGTAGTPNLTTMTKAAAAYVVTELTP